MKTDNLKKRLFQAGGEMGTPATASPEAGASPDPVMEGGSPEEVPAEGSETEDLAGMLQQYMENPSDELAHSIVGKVIEMAQGSQPQSFKKGGSLKSRLYKKGGDMKKESFIKKVKSKKYGGKAKMKGGDKMKGRDKMKYGSKMKK